MPACQCVLPSLHLDIADCHRRLGDPEAARRHLTRAEADIDVLTHDDHGRLIRAGMDLVRAALAAGSTAPLSTAP